jgi:hypothetical protein
MSIVRGVVLAVLGGFALSLAACGGNESTPTPPVGGTLYFSQDGNANGLFTLNQTTGAATKVGAGTTGVVGVTVGLTEGPNGTLLGSTFPQIVRIARDGSGVTDLVGNEGAEALAWNSANGLLYGCWNADFYNMDVATGVRIATLPTAPADVEGLAADGSRNVIYGIGDHTNLFKYDVATATWSTVGNTGINWNQGGLAFDAETRTLYAVGVGGGVNLYKINPDTAAPTVVGPLGISGVVNGGLAFVPN